GAGLGSRSSGLGHALSLHHPLSRGQHLVRRCRPLDAWRVRARRCADRISARGLNAIIAAAKDCQTMTLRGPLVLAVTVLASALAACTALSVVLAPAPVTIATATPGTIDHPIGNAICRLYNLTEN